MTFGNPEIGIFNIMDYGADPSGQRDSTEAIQKTIDLAASYCGGQGGVAQVPPGIYLCADAKMRRQVLLQGTGTWGYRVNGSCVLKAGPNAKTCILDLSDAFSCSVSCITVDGNDQGENIHGFYFYRERMGGEAGTNEEDIPTLDNCKAAHCSGDGIHYENIWCYRIHHCQVKSCRNGLFAQGVDGFILDNWFSSNREWGICTSKDFAPNSAVLVTGCRVEWNRLGGFLLTGTEKWQISNCSFDRNFGPSISCISSGHRRVPHNHTIAITGNVFNRSGVGREGDHNAHLILDGAFNTVVSGNTFCTGADDDYTGEASPKFAIVVKDLKSTVITNNVLQNSCTEQVLVDHGGHYFPAENDANAGLIYENNPGCPFPESARVMGRYYAIQKDVPNG